MDILNTEYAVRRSFNNEPATAEAVTAIILWLRALIFDCIAWTVNVFPVSPGASKKYAWEYAD